MSKGKSEINHGRLTVILIELQFPQSCQSKQETKDEELHQQRHKMNKILNGVTAAISNGMIAWYYKGLF